MESMSLSLELDEVKLLRKDQYLLTQVFDLTKLSDLVVRPTQVKESSYDPRGVSEPLGVLDAALEIPDRLIIAPHVRVQAAE